MPRLRASAYSQLFFVNIFLVSAIVIFIVVVSVCTNRSLLVKNFSYSTSKLLAILLILFPLMINGQTELVPVGHKAYSFFENLSKKEIIEYDNGSIPLSRGETASFLKKIELSKDRLTTTEINILNDLTTEFSYDLDKKLDKSISLFSEFSLRNIFSNDKQKYLAALVDENASFFLDGTAFISYRDFNTESFAKTNLTLGQIGIRLRGTLYNTIGYYLRMSNGQQIKGDTYSRIVAAKYDRTLAGTIRFIDEKYFDSFEGYLRYESENHAVALTFGRDNFEMGNGYIDKLFISNNIPPFDFARIDLKYKAFKYTFFYGNIKGDSLGIPLASKNIVGHRLDVKFSNSFRLGLYESIIISNAPISFTYINPISLLTSADFSSKNEKYNNALMGIDFEIKPVKNIGMQFSLLIDDLNFSTLTKKDVSGNDNKFAYQGGLIYIEPFGINDLTAIVEYTRIDPFVYSHRSNMSTYTHWGIGIGHLLPPNSDEITLMLNYNLTNRIKLNFEYKHRRSGEGFLYDANGKIIQNYGGDINRGDLDAIVVNTFLMGYRVNRDIFNFSIHIEPVRQFYVDINYSFQSIDKIYLSSTFSDQFLYATISTDF
jgi:hypothetical protein